MINEVSIKANGSKPFVRYDGGFLVKIDNCYFTSTAFGSAQGKDASSYTADRSTFIMQFLQSKSSLKRRPLARVRKSGSCQVGWVPPCFTQ